MSKETRSEPVLTFGKEPQPRPERLTGLRVIPECDPDTSIVSIEISQSPFRVLYLDCTVRRELVDGVPTAYAVLDTARMVTWADDAPRT